MGRGERGAWHSWEPPPLLCGAYPHLRDVTALHGDASWVGHDLRGLRDLWKEKPPHAY